jgi:pyruvate,water dikinase
MVRARFIRWFHEIGIADIPLVGGKNASLGEMYRELTPKGIKIPNGFAITAEGYWSVVRAGGLTEAIRTILSDLDTRDLANLAQRGRQVREMILIVGVKTDGLGPDWLVDGLGCLTASGARLTTNLELVESVRK